MHKFESKISLKFAKVYPQKLFIEVVARKCSVKKLFLEISQNWQENTCARVSACIFITLAQVFPCEFCEISKNTFSYRTPPMAASVFSSLNICNKVKKSSKTGRN